MRFWRERWDDVKAVASAMWVASLVLFGITAVFGGWVYILTRIVERL